MKYVTKPVVVEAFQLPGLKDAPEPFMEWAEKVGFEDYTSGRDGGIELLTEDGETYREALPGEWVVQDADGEFVAYPDAIFRESFELTH